MPTAKSKLKPLKEEAPRAWQRMLSGRRLDLLNPSPLDIEIEDIAHGLARVLFIEQLYRAWCLASGHPYHRA